MSGSVDNSFLGFLRGGIERGGFETDDTLAAVLPLMQQVAAVHETGKVAPLRGTDDLVINEGVLSFDPTKAREPKKQTSRIEALQGTQPKAVEIVGHSRRISDIDAGSLRVTNLEVNAGEAVEKPGFLPNYICWEQACGHHDELTDIFSLGLILASFACSLDFSDLSDVELFASNRANLFALKARLNPVVAAVIVEMTELNRHRRTQDLGALIRRLQYYREQQADFDVERIKGFKDSALAGKRTLIQTHLRDRLFEISRRNRLIYFKPTLQTLNLTVASVPLMLDYRNIRLEQLFVWHPELARTVAEGAPMSLGKYLRFEDAPYISGVLDKIISEARRDRAEYGFAQLRLVLCFLRWNNLKEAPNERIDSPLLLLPAELTRKKGVRDNYVLDPTTSEAEVNPALRHHLKDLYNLNLPETVDLRETSLDDFHQLLQTQIQASEPGVTLKKIDRPQIELIHERARQRLDQYRRRLKLQAKPARSYGPADYSYDRQNLRPLGLQLFQQKIRPQPAPLRDAAGAPPKPRLPHIVDPQKPEEPGKILETERDMFALRESDNGNRYSWDFDLCSLTLGNFNYRKMTLVRDYNNLIETDLASAAFDSIFSLTPRNSDETAEKSIEFSDQYFVVPCDATQASAIARARAGRSYIIQGPPGTGKSQTITNLIADYVANGKRVLFVCEKRAAIDVVYHRLRQKGLDELCCLIHDSQTDKKSFIQNLKQTYDQFLNRMQDEDSAEQARSSSLQAIEQDLGALRRFSDAMSRPQPAAGIPLRNLLQRLVELRLHAPKLPPEQEEQLPDYNLWLEHGAVVRRLAAALVDLGDDPCFARHPFRLLGRAVIEAERPLDMLSTCLQRVESMMDAVESALELSGLPTELWDTIEEIKVILDFAAQVKPLGDSNLLILLDPASSESKAFAELVADHERKAAALKKAREKTGNWKERLSPDDTHNALGQARKFEGSILRFVQPAFWRLRKILQARYDFSQHVIAPGWVQILKELDQEYQASAQCEEVRQKAAERLNISDLEATASAVAAIRSAPAFSHPSIKALCRELVNGSQGRGLLENLCALQPDFHNLGQTLSILFVESGAMSFADLSEAVTALRNETGALPELLPILSELIDLPETLSRALRVMPLRSEQLEAGMGEKNLNGAYRIDRQLGRFDGVVLGQRLERMAAHYRDFLNHNAQWIRALVQRKFVEHVNISSLSATQLDAEQKLFKKSYMAGRRELEHEFGKTMRFRSIRDLAAGPSGQVIQDLKPIWLMSPLSVSDTLPLEARLFDVVIFDEASQIPIEEAIPALYRSNQVIVVGDEMQLPPTTFFSSSRSGDESVIVEEEGERIEVDLDADSFLAQSSRNLPSTLLAWHYRSRYESLISFSNAAFYSGNLYTIPDRQLPTGSLAELRIRASDEAAKNVESLLQRSISFHFQENGIYEQRRNAGEAAYIARMVRALLQRETGLSIGIVAFSEAQQTEVESALEQLADEDPAFATRLEAEYTREENDQFCGLIIKNLENVQGDERDIIILSICYGYDANRKMLMNFGPINQKGGEKRLNVIFSRAKHHMAIVSSIRHADITNDYNDGASSLRNFLHYAESVSKGDAPMARRVLENLNPLARKSLGGEEQPDVVVNEIAAALRERGLTVDLRVGQSRFRCDLGVRNAQDGHYQLGILVDTASHYANANPVERYLMQPAILRAFGWTFALVLTKDWYHDPRRVIERLLRMMQAGVSDEVAELEPISLLVPARTGARSSESTIQGPAAPPTESARKTVTTQTQRSTARYFEFHSPTSQKFWEVEVLDTTLTVRFGRIGTNGQAQTKSFDNARTAQAEAARLIREKLTKGYQEKPKMG